MSNLFRDGERLVLTPANNDNAVPIAGMNHAMISPILIGMVVPFLLLYLIDPAILRHVRLVVWIALSLMFVITTVLFMISLWCTGTLTGVICDRNRRSVELLWQTPLSTKSQEVPFKDVSALRVRAQYDDDGYTDSAAELILRSKQCVTLPAGTTETQLAPMRAAIGLG